MIKNENVIVLDIDGTITMENTYNGDYSQVMVNDEFLEKIREFKRMGFWIILYTSRNMKTYQGNEGRAPGTRGAPAPPRPGR